MAMTRDEFRSAVQRHGYRLTDFADDFGVAYDTVRKWGNGNGVPRWAVRVLALMDQHGRAHVEGPKAIRPRQPAEGAAASAARTPALAFPAPNALAFPSSSSVKRT
jgi:hypothetical protein